MDIIRLSPLAAAMALLIVSPGFAAKPINLQDANFQSIQQQFSVALPGAQQGFVPTSDTLKLLKIHTDKNNVHHLRMQQMYAGFPVFGGDAIFHGKQAINQFAATPDQITMNGKIYQDLSTDLGQPAADFVPKGQDALHHFMAKYSQFHLSQKQVMPLVYVDKNHKAHWAYKVSVHVRYTDKIPARPTAIIDAESFNPFVEWDDIKTSARAKVFGKGFGGNQKMGELKYGSELPLLEITRNNAQKICYMENTNVRVIDMNHDYINTTEAMKFDCKRMAEKKKKIFWTGYQADGYDRENGAYSPSNDALYAGQVIKNMYHEWYNVEALTNDDGSPMQLVMRVHYGEGYENAFWDGEQMTFGDGASFFYPLVSLGVSSHEVSHGFTEQHSGLNYFGQSGGMNESFSDMAAQAAEFYSFKESSWLIGAEIIKEDTELEALRYMDLPSRDKESIDSADQYRKGMDVHNSSGVYNRLFYTLAHQPGWDTRKAFDVMVKANMDYWTPSETFNSAGCGVLHAAQDLGYSISDVKNSLDVVVVKYLRCNI